MQRIDGGYGEESGERRTRRRAGATAGLLLAVAAGCSVPFGQIDAAGYTSHRYAFRIRAASGGHVISSDWLVDNFYPSRNGFEPRTGPAFEEQYHFDLDGNGIADYTAVLPLYELLLRHRRDAGRVWARTVPLNRLLDETDLRVLARRYVDSVTGTGTVVSSLATDDGMVTVEAHSNRFATRVLETQSLAVAGFEAFSVTFEVANVDQLSLSADSLWSRARVVLVRSGFLWGGYGSWHPVILLLGYSNLPEYFEAHAAEFEYFLASIDWLDQELQAARQSVLECTSAELVRIFASPGRSMRRWGTAALSPDITDAEYACLVSRLPATPVSYAVRRTGYEPPAPAPVPPAAPDSPTDPDPSNSPPEGSSDPAGLPPDSPENPPTVPSPPETPPPPEPTAPPQ